MMASLIQFQSTVKVENQGDLFYVNTNTGDTDTGDSNSQPSNDVKKPDKEGKPDTTDSSTGIKSESKDDTDTTTEKDPIFDKDDDQPEAPPSDD